MTTTHEYRGYVFTIAVPAAGTTYTVDFPDVPDIITSGQPDRPFSMPVKR